MEIVPFFKSIFSHLSAHNSPILIPVYRHSIEALDSYTRAGMVLNVDDTDYLIESAHHSVKNGVHYVKMDLRRFG